MSEFKELEEKVVKFNEERNWDQFHTPKDLAISVSLEANEVLEHFQWKTPEECTEYLKGHKDDVAEEMADVLLYLLIMSHKLGIDLKEAAELKLKKNATRYPVEKAHNSHKKYTEF